MYQLEIRELDLDRLEVREVVQFSLGRDGIVEFDDVEDPRYALFSLELGKGLSTPEFMNIDSENHLVSTHYLAKVDGASFLICWVISDPAVNGCWFS